jgi:DNA adenine methylase
LFNQFKNDPHATHFAQQRAQRFFYANRCSFSGTTHSGGFSRDAAMNRFTQSSIDRLRKLPEALYKIEITNLDYLDLIKAKLGHRCFYFFDPPYPIKSDKLYGVKGSLHGGFDHEKLANDIRYNCNGKFLITYNDCELIRSLYSWATIKEWNLQYSMGGLIEGRKSMGAEVFITNF